MAGSRVAERFALRQREKRIRALRYAARLLLISVIVLVCTVVPTLLHWWDTVVPAAIGTAIVALLLFGILVSLPLEFVFCYIWLYFDGEPNRIPHPGPRFGRALYRESARLDEWAREAGLPPLTDFESPDVTETGEPPRCRPSISCWRAWNPVPISSANCGNYSRCCASRASRAPASTSCS
jgi:hypothetical protein